MINLHLTVRQKLCAGIGLIEVVVGIGIVTFVLLGSISAVQLFASSSRTNLDRVQAAYFLDEGVEAVRFIRDTGWSTDFDTLAEGTPYYLVFEGSAWSATTTPDSIDGTFERVFTLSPVYRRDSDDDIVASTSPDAKTLDPNTKRVEVVVSWSASSSLQAVTYLTNLFEEE